MRKLLFIFVIGFIISSGAAYATNIYVEGAGSYGNYADAKTMAAGFFGFGFPLTDNVNFYARGLYGEASTSQNGQYTDKSKILGALGVVEYAYYFRNAPVHIGLSASAGAGYVRAEIAKLDEGSDKLVKHGDSSPYLGAWVGPKLICTQRITVFALAGYQGAVSFQGPLQGKSVQGFQFLAGVTVTLNGANSSITEEY